MQTATVSERPPQQISAPARSLPASLPRPLRSVLPALLTAGGLIAAWLIVAPRSPDLAAQVYRANLFSHFGMLIWDDNWYGGHHMPGYSLVYPPLAALLGVRPLGALAALASTALFARIVTLTYGPRTTLATIWFAVAACGDLWIGRITFALGVSFALGAVLALVALRRRAACPPLPAKSRRRTRSRLPIARPGSSAGTLLACLCGALSAVTSPVAALLLGLAISTEMLVHRRLRPGVYVILAILVVLLPLELLFPEGGFEPYGFNSFAAASAVALAFVWALPRGERLLRTGGLLFLLVNLLALVPTPMGSNVVRYAVLLSGPLLLCALGRGGFSAEASTVAYTGSFARPRALGRGGSSAEAPPTAGQARPSLSAKRWNARSLLRRRWGTRPGWAVLAALIGIGVWVLWGPVLQTREVLNDPSTQASYYLPVRRFLALHAKRPVRIEVPFTRSHWESALLAPYVSLARGWERQLDKRYDLAIEADPLQASVYHRWLRRNAVSYVALPDVPLDGSSKGEAALIRHGVPFLSRVFESRHWTIYRVLHSNPLAAGPGTLVSLGHQSFTLAVRSPGSFLVRVHYTPYWTVVAGAGSVAEAAGGWTEVRARRSGTLRVEARFSLQAALKLL